MMRKPTTTRRPPPPPPPTVEQRRAELGRDIASFLASRQQAPESDSRLQHKQEALIDTVRDVNSGCARIGVLLSEFEANSGLPGPGDLTRAPPLEPVDEVEDDEVTTLRALAADDTAMDVASVVNYAAAPPCAPPFSHTSVPEARNGMEESLRKIRDSLDNLDGALAGVNHWWASQILLRRLRTHIVRVNYHARLMQRWGNQARSHLYVSTELSNRTSIENAHDLARFAGKEQELREKRQELQRREADLGVRLATARAELDGLTATHDQESKQLLLQAEAMGVVRVGAEAAEALLLLQAIKLRYPYLADNAQRMQAVLKKPGTLLDTHR